DGRFTAQKIPFAPFILAWGSFAYAIRAKISIQFPEIWAFTYREIYWFPRFELSIAMQHIGRILVIGLVWTAVPRIHAADKVDFAHAVLPLLREHCAKCHPNGRYARAISRDTREAVLEAGIAPAGKSSES